MFCDIMSGIYEITRQGRYVMDITYKRLWKLLIDREIGKGQLKELSGVSGNIIAKLGKDEPVSLESLVKIAIALKVDIGDIISLEEK